MTEKNEFYRDEHPETENISGGWGGGSSGGGGGWGGGGGGGGGGGDGNGGGWGGGGNLGFDFSPSPANVALNLTSGGDLLLDGDGNLVLCGQSCVTVPALIAYLTGEDCDSHWDCVLCKTTSSIRPAKLKRISGAASRESQPVLMSYWPLGEPGSYEIRAKWQEGHYDHREVKSVRFVIYGVSTGWQTLPLSRYQTIATVVVGEDYRITVNGQPAKLTGNRSILETA